MPGKVHQKLLSLPSTEHDMPDSHPPLPLSIDSGTDIILLIEFSEFSSILGGVAPPSRPLLIKVRVRTWRFEGNHIHSNTLWTWGIQKM